MRLSYQIPIWNRLGLHLRAAAQLVRVTSRFKCRIDVAAGGSRVNAKSILGILTLGAIYGTLLEFWAEGEDATEAVEAIRKLMHEWKEE